MDGPTGTSGPGPEHERPGLPEPTPEELFEAFDVAEAERYLARQPGVRRALKGAYSMESMSRTEEALRRDDGLLTIAEAYVDKGEPEQALELVTGLTPFDRVRVEIAVAAHEVRTGQTDEGGRRFGRAWGVLVHGYQDYTKGASQLAWNRAVAELAYRQTELGMTDEAVGYMGLIHDQPTRINLMADMGYWCAQGRNDAGSQRWLTAATHEVAETKASGKTPAEAKSASYGLSVRHLSDTLAELGQYDKARAVAGHDVDAYERSNALRRYDFAERYGEQYLRSRVPAKPKKDWELGFAMEAASNLKKTWREVSSPDVSYRWLPLAAVAQSTGQLEEARAIRDWIRGQLEGDFSHKSRARELHGGLAGLELKAGNLDAAIEDLKRGAAPGFELSYLGPVGAAVIRKCLDEGRLDDALDVGNSLGWPIETLRTYRYIDNDRIIDRPPGGLPPHARLIEALAVRGDITLAKGVERATEKEAKDQFGNSALVSGLIRGGRDRELALARVRGVAGHLPHEPEPPESTVNVNVAALLELAGSRPDAVRRLGAYVRSADQLKGVLAQLDHSKTLSLEERVRMTAALLEASDKNEWAAELAEREDPVRAAVAERHRGAKPDQVLGLQNRAVAQMRQNLERMEVFRRNAEIVDLEKMLEKGYTLAEMVRYPWLMRYDTYSTIAEKFPASAGTLTQERWIAENSYALMQGFDKGRIGRIVRQRLENGQETSLHDASQWLEGFKIPERRLDRAKYMATVAELGEGQVDLDECMVRLYAPEAEKMFLAAFWLQAGGTEKLPTNPRQYEQLFSEPVYAMVYQAMLEVRESGGSRDDVRKLVLGRYGTYKEAMKVGGTVQVPTTMEEYTRLVDSVFSYMSMADAGGLDARRTMLELKEMGKARREYIEETTSWLEASRNAPSQRLMRAWGDRDWALMDGVPDRAIDLERWSKTNGLMQLVKKLERKEDSPHGKKGTLDLSSVSDKGTLFEGRLKVANDLTIEEIRGKYGKYLDELVVRYPAAEALWAIGWIKENLNTKADIPPVVIELEGGYVWEIIPKDDPRGFTIGYDTVCCMKIGGEGQSCMEAGYFDRRYAFATLYQPSGQLLSQAVAYHNPKVSADTLVLDNIELNQGRDQGRVLELNRQALTAYLTKTDAGKSTPFSKVNLGLGYLDVNASGYTQVNDPVPTPLPSVYTDAESQVWILEVERGEVQRRPHERFETVDSGDAEMIAELERSIYPLAMREGAGAFVDHLDVPPRDNFSFVIRASSEDAPIGYIIATRDDLDQSEIYIDDLAVLPEYQRGLWGPLAMGELFRRLSEAPDVERITLHARATTSYRAFSSERIRSRIEAAGWRVTRQEPQEEFYRDGEDAYYIELERIAA